MKNIHMDRFPVIVVLSCLLTLTACGGSSNSTSEDAIGGQSDDPSGLAGNGALNGGLSGRLVMSNDDMLPIEIDLSSGTSRLLPIRTLQESIPDENLEDGIRQGYFTGSVNGSGYAQSIEECIDREES